MHNTEQTRAHMHSASHPHPFIIHGICDKTRSQAVARIANCTASQCL